MDLPFFQSGQTHSSILGEIQKYAENEDYSANHDQTKQMFGLIFVCTGPMGRISCFEQTDS